MKSRGPMKIILFHLAVLGCTVAVPSGYYHQEYNYKTSASSFKNNELQRKTDDQGYYRKDGDLDGRVKPVVDANSEHSEYVNPNTQTGQYYGGANTDFSSTGNMRAQSGYNGYGSNALEAEGLARSDRIIGSAGYSSGADTGYSSTGNIRSENGYNGYGSHAVDAERLAQSGRVIGSTGYSSGYGSNSLGSHSQSYGTSNLRLITSRLQQELESDLQEAVRQNNIYPQTRVDIAQLERELRQNMTERLNNELTAKFGQQMVRGGMSYTITGGRLQSTANYDNEELSNLKSQLENSLINQLRTQYSSSSSSNSQYYNRQGSYGYTTTVRPVYHSVYPSLPSYTTTVRYPVDYNQGNYQTVRYTPITNPQSITNIASRVQNQLDTRLNEVLDETRRKHFSSDAAYSLTNTDVLLERIRNELRSNLTYILDEDIRRNYGTQIQRDGYLYSVGPSGQTSTDYNYSLRDLENLKQQVERNLIEKLNRDFETHRSSWSSRQSYNSQSSYGSNYQYSSTPSYYELITTPRQSYVNPYPASTSNQGGYIKTGSSASNQYGYGTGSQQSGYGVQSSSSIAQLQRQLQDDLSRQLRGALSTGHYTSHSANGVYSPQNYQTTLQQLSDDLNRNLTRHLREYSAMGSYAAYGNFDSAQMQRLKTQLQDSLMSQLQQGLQQSYQASSSYSSSSSSSSNSNYRPVRGFQDYQAGQYRSGIETVAGEDCAGDDPNAYSHVRAKRSFRLLGGNGGGQSQLGLHLGLFQGNRGSSHYVQHPTELGQELDDYDSTQQIEDSGYGKISNYGQGRGVGQRAEYRRYEFSQGHGGEGQRAVYRKHEFSHGHDQTEVGQQIDDNDDYENGELHVSHLGQQTDESDLTQQVENSRYGKLQVSGQGQHMYDSDLTQQVEDSGYGKSQTSNQGQQYDNSYLTQQVVDSDYKNLQFSNQGQQIDDSDSIPQVQDSSKVQVLDQLQHVNHADLTQQVEDSDYKKLQFSNQGQHVDDAYLTRQVEDSDYRKLKYSNRGQQVDDSDSIPHVQDSGKLQVSNQGKHVDDADLTQQVEDSSYGKLQIPNQGQQVDNSYLTQQIEDSAYRKLQYSNQGQHIDDSDSIAQVQDSGKLQLSSQDQHVDDADLTQQVEDSGYGKLQTPNQGQQIDNSYLTQQVEDSDYRKLQYPNQGQQVDDSDSIPQVQDSGKLQLSNQDQHVDDADLTQQVEDSGYGKLQTPNQGQQIDNSYLTQQVEDSDYRKLQYSNQGQQVDDSDSIPQVQDSGKLQLSNQDQHVDDADLTQQVEDSGYGKLQSPNQGQQIDNSYLTQQVEDSDYRKLQYSNQGQQVDDSDSIPQVPDSGELQVSNQGKHVDNAELTQQVEDSDYRKLQYSNQGQHIDDSDSIAQVQDSGKLQLSNQDQHVDDADLTQQVEDSGYGILRTPNQGQQIDESDLIPQVQDSGNMQVSNQGKHVDDADLNQEVEDPGYGKLQIPNQGQQVDNSYSTQQAEVSDNKKLQFSNQGQPVDDSGSYPQYLSQGQHLDDSDLTQQVENSGYGKLPVSSNQEQQEQNPTETMNLGQQPPQAVDERPIEPEEALGQHNEKPGIEQGRVIPQNEDVIPNHQVYPSNGPKNVQTGSQISNWELCSKYIDTSLMDVPWQLSNQFKEEIVKQYQPLAYGITNSQKDQVHQKILAGLPKNIMYHCYKVIDMNVNQQTEDEQVEQLESYFRYLINQEINDIVKRANEHNEQKSNQIPEKLEVTAINGSGSENEYEGIDQWCSKYIDTSLMDAPWTLSSQLEEEINREYHLIADGTTASKKNILYKQILAKLPKNIMYTCFQISYVKLSDQDKVVEELENYFKSLIKQKIDSVVEDNKINQQNSQTEKLEVNTITGSSSDIEHEKIEELCSKYIDTSLMDTSWRLSSQLEEEINREYHLLADGTTESKIKILYARILATLPKNIMYTCFNVNDMKLSKQDEDVIAKGLENHLKSLIQQKLDGVVEDDEKKQQNQLPQLEKVEVTTIIGSNSENEYEKIKKLCSKYIDTSLMDTYWRLSRQLEEEIIREYHLLADGSAESKINILYARILAKLPKNIMYTCFHVNDMKLSKQEEDDIVKQHENHLKFLIQQKLDSVVEDDKNDQHNQLPQLENVEVTTIIGSNSENEYEKIKKLCSKYIDTSLMDTYWRLSRQLEEEIIREYHLLADGSAESKINILYARILAKLPKNIMYTCFHVNDMKLSKQEEDDIVKQHENHLKFLIQQKLDSVVEDDKNDQHNQLPQLEKVEVTTIIGSSSENEYEKIKKLCSKYIDTSLMDTYWRLSRQLEEEIIREYHLLADGSAESKINILNARILAKLPKNIMYTCFHVNDMKLSKQEEDDIVKQHENHLKFLIQQKLDSVVEDDKNNQHNQLPQLEKVEATEQETESLSRELIIEDWCTKYIDKSMMDAPWQLGIQLKSTISKECSRSSSDWQFIYQRLLNEIPLNITDCFNMQDMGLNELQLAEKRQDIETYLKSLIKNEVVTMCKLGDNSPKIEYDPVPLGTLPHGQTTQKSTVDVNQYPQTHSTNEIGRPPKVNELPTSNQLTETNPKREENLPQPQIINVVQPEQSEVKAIEITDQGQILHRPQTLPEAEQTADSLINALKNSQTTRHNQQTIDDYNTGYNYHGRQSYDLFGRRSQVYDNTRPFGSHGRNQVYDNTRPFGSHGLGYYHYPKFYRPRSSLIHTYGYGQHRPYESQIGEQSYDKLSSYNNKPTDYNHRPSAGSYGSSTYQARNTDGYFYQPQSYHKPLNHGQVEVVEQNVETTSDIEPVRTGHANVRHSVEPVYSGVKGRNRLSGSSYQHSSPYPRPSQVQLEPVAIQKIVRQDSIPPQAVHETTPLATENENVSWWKRFGNKVKQGAADLKKKVIGR